MKIDAFYSRRYYIIFSIIFSIFWLLFKVGGMGNIRLALLSTLIDVVAGIVSLVITVNWLLPKFLYRKRNRLFIVTFLLLIFLAGSGIILCQLKLFGSSLGAYQQNLTRYSKTFFYWFWADLIFGSYFLIFFVSSAGAAIRFALDRLKSESLIEKLEKEKLNIELDSLKNQINPHFLFNALNTIYYKIEKRNHEARETLQTFSKMLRYQLYDCNQPFIPIENELNFLKSYIEMQKERMNDHYEINYRGFDDTKGFIISPFLLMPIVENCFKHVAGDHSGTHSISIEAEGNDHFFYLFTSNDMRLKETNEREGIGIKNIKKRLDLIYPGKHELVIQSLENRFEVKLKIWQ